MLTAQFLPWFHFTMSQRVQKFDSSNFANLSGSARMTMTIKIKMR